MPRGRGRVGPVLLGRDDARRVARQPGRDDERPAGALQRGAERLDGMAVGVRRGLEVPREGDVVLEREVDDAVGARRARAQDVEVVDAAAEHLTARRLQRGGQASERARPTTLFLNGLAGAPASAGPLTRSP